MIYLGLFSDKDSLRDEFSLNSHEDDSDDENFKIGVDLNLEDEKNIDTYDILLAWYCYEDYSGSAFVLMTKNKKFYIVEGSHCSCYGLEGQFNPSEIDLDYLRHRAEEGFYQAEEGDSQIIKSFIGDIILTAEHLGEEFFENITENMYKHSSAYRKYCIDNMGKELLN